MRIQRVRAMRTPELGEIDLSPGSGLVGWSGGTARDRRLFSDLLRWALGMPSRGRTPGAAFTAGAPSWSRASGREDGGEGLDDPRPSGSWGFGRGPDGAEMEVTVGGSLLRLRVGAGVPGIGDDGIRELQDRLGIPAGALAFAWTGGGWTEPESLWRAGARLLAARRGLTRLEEGLSRLIARSSEDGAPDPSGASTPGTLRDPGMRSVERADPTAEAELSAVTARLDELADVPERLRSLEDELRTLRADAAEVVGDLEVATMDWLRERQDAETHLQQYRSEARELRARMEEMEEKGPEGTCPFCGRPLDDHLDKVMAELQEEWDALVQDGSWWRRRRDQLELKPDELQELERRSVRLQAEVEECAEQLERCRFELREWDELRGRREELVALMGISGGGAGSEEEDREPRDDRNAERDGDVGDARQFGGVPPTGGSAERRRRTLERAFRDAREGLLREERRRLARSAGSLLNRISGGRILGLVEEGYERLGVLEDGRVVAGVTVEDRAAAAVALHLALTVRLVESGIPLESMLVGETFRAMDPEARIRTVEIYRGLRDRIPQIFLLWGGEVVDAVPERFDHILEFRADRDRPSVRSIPGGVGRLRIS